MGKNHQVMNKSLARIHLGVAIFYGLLPVLAKSMDLYGMSMTDALMVMAFFAPLLALHAFALTGVRQGRGWGRTLSRVLGVMLIFIFPLGPVVGGFVLMRTGKKYWEHAAP